MGKTLQVNNDKEYIVTGVMEDVPSNSLLQFDFVGSFASLAAAKEQIWWSANYQTFVLLAPGTNGVIHVRLTRKGGFAGEVQLGIEGLPHVKPR